jgi:hypothetical protein
MLYGCVDEMVNEYLHFPGFAIPTGSGQSQRTGKRTIAGVAAEAGI